MRQCSSLYALAELAANASTEESAWTEMESNVEKEQLGCVKGNPTTPNSMNLKMDAPPPRGRRDSELGGFFDFRFVYIDSLFEGRFLIGGWNSGL